MIESFKIAENIQIQVGETCDKFIFSVLNKYILDNFNIVVEKEELVRAIQLVRIYKEYGSGISEPWTTATQQTAALGDAYHRGFRDGVLKEHDRIMDILEKEE